MPYRDAPFCDFLDYLSFNRRYSAKTVQAYGSDLEQFTGFLRKLYGPDTLLEAVTGSMVRSWLADLKDKNQSSRSINRKISALKSYYKYLMREQRIDASPMRKVIAPKQGKRLPAYVEEPAMVQLLDPARFSEDWKGRTERLVLELLYQTGIRLSELLQLKNSQVDYSLKSLRVLGKGSKERILPLSDPLLALLRDYQQAKPRMLEHFDSERLLVLSNGKPLYASFVYRLVRAQLGTVTTQSKRSPHVLRHTFATHLSNHGAELHAVKELLGHASLAATQVYTHNTVEQLKRIYQQAHPKSGS